MSCLFLIKAFSASCLLIWQRSEFWSPSALTQIGLVSENQQINGEDRALFISDLKRLDHTNPEIHAQL